MKLWFRAWSSPRLGLALLLLLRGTGLAASLEAGEPATGFDQFGAAVSVAGSIGMVGAQNDDLDGHEAQGSASVFRDLETAVGTMGPVAKLAASDGAAYAALGNAVSLDGPMALVGAYVTKIGQNSAQGAAYVFRGLDVAAGPVTERAKLISSDGATNDGFGFAVSLSGSSGLIGTFRGNFSVAGVAYLFRNLDTVTGTVMQQVKLTAAHAIPRDYFGTALSLAGSLGWWERRAALPSRCRSRE